MRSIDFNWLSRMDKQLLLPDLEYGHVDGGQGCYFHPVVVPLKYGRHAQLHNGRIVIDTDDSAAIEATMAHEWRHHWQLFSLGHDREPRIIIQDWREDYEKKIRQFFLCQPREMDALRFELTKFPTDQAKRWVEMLRRGK